MSIPVAPVFLGGHPALDFLNTAFAPDGVQMEAIGDGRALLDWLIGAQLLDRTAVNALAVRSEAKALESTATKLRKFRDQTRTWLERWRAAPERGYKSEIAALNDVIATGVWRHRVVISPDGPHIIEQLEVSSADALLPLLAWQIALLVTQEPASLIKQCAGAGCTLWFLDRTKAHRRRFCSTTVCGNRAKVAAFRQRQRE
jgi:predicted RNA-binding Zn ribbon-like protein